MIAWEWIIQHWGEYTMLSQEAANHGANWAVSTTSRMTIFVTEPRSSARRLGIFPNYGLSHTLTEKFLAPDQFDPAFAEVVEVSLTD